MTRANADTGGSRGCALVWVHLDVKQSGELAGLNDLWSTRCLGAFHRVAFVAPPHVYRESSRNPAVEFCMAHSFEDRGHERQTGVNGADDWLETGYDGGQRGGFGVVMGIVVD